MKKGENFFHIIVVPYDCWKHLNMGLIFETIGPQSWAPMPSGFQHPFSNKYLLI